MHQGESGFSYDDALDSSVVANSGGGLVTRTFQLNGKQVPLVGGGTPVVGRTLKNGMTEVKTHINGSNDAVNVFKNLVGDSAKPLANGKDFRSVLGDGREVIYRPSSSSGGIPKIDIRWRRFNDDAYKQIERGATERGTCPCLRRDSDAHLDYEQAGDFGRVLLKHCGTCSRGVLLFMGTCTQGGRKVASLSV